jgi:hypothetical protein
MGPKQSAVMKGQLGPLSKLAQLAPRINPCRKPRKPIRSFGHHAFEGEGVAFPSPTILVNACSPKPQHRNQNSPRASATMCLKARVILFYGKESKKRTSTEASISHQKIAQVQSQCGKVMLLGESVRINHSFSSSGLNPVCEGLLLEMRKGGHKEIPTKLHLVHRTFVDIVIANTFIICFAGRDSVAQSRRASDPRQIKTVGAHHGAA